MPYDLTVCIVTYRTEHGILDECIQSVFRESSASGIDCEVMVIDNSCDDSLEAFKPRVHSWVSMTANEGFARAANQGVSRAAANSVLLLNPDAALEPGSLSALLDGLQRAGGPALLCGWLEINSSVQVDAFMVWWTSSERMLRRARYRAYLEGSMTLDAVPVEKISGGALFGRRDVLLKLGPFDERYFLYGEDVDLSVRAARAKLGLYAIPTARIAHVGSSSSRDHSDLVEAARADAAIRLNAYHLPYVLSILTRFELLAVTLVGLVPGLGRSSGRTSARRSRLAEFARWGFRRDVTRFTPPTAARSRGAAS